MIKILGLVAIVSILVTIFTYNDKEGFKVKVSGEDLLTLSETLNVKDRRKLELLNDTSFFELDGSRIVVKTPVSIDTELRMSGRDSGVDIVTSDGMVGGIEFYNENADLSRVGEVLDYERGSVPLKFVIRSKDGSQESIRGSLAGHTNKYEAGKIGYIPGYPKNYTRTDVGGVRRFKDKVEALVACDAHPYCKGITYHTGMQEYTLRGGSDRVRNGNKGQIHHTSWEVSYLKKM